MSASGSDGSGSATLAGGRPISMVADGACLVGTIENLRAGHAAKPMSDQALAKVRKDALTLLEDAIRAYDAGVASGEVGSGGSGRVAAGAPAPERCPTGLLYGRIQSGKTVAMITFTAAALDNGFRVVVVLTSDYLKLVEQTADRFGALAGPIIKHSQLSETWSADAAHVAAEVADHGLVVVCSKNQARLKTLIEFLHNVGAAGFPALILDDEADQATLDTTTAARAAGSPSAPTHASVIHRRTVRNPVPWEEGESIRERLPHHLFLQVTATPYALLLQNVDHELRPSFTRLLEPGDGYTGGEAFFDERHVDGGEPPVVFVDDNESHAIESGSEAPDGLKKAIAFFLVAAAAQSENMPSLRALGQNFLCHTSHRTSEHSRAAALIRDYLARISEDLRNGVPDGETLLRLEAAYEELRKTLPEPPPFGRLREAIRAKLVRREVITVNSMSNPAEFGRQLNFIIGGNILGRGLTIENLLVSYYIRKPKISQMDTVLQHARMFGYRATLMPYTRVFLPDSLAFRFHYIHVAEQRLRTQLATPDARSRVLVQTADGLRPTRMGVLDTGSLSAYEGGQQIYPIAPALDTASLGRNGRIEAEAKAAFGGTLRPSEFVEVPLEQLIRLMRLVPFDETEAGSWDPDALERLLRGIQTDYGNRGYVYYRRMERERKMLTTGAADGKKEVPQARAKKAPVLMLFRDSGKHLGGKEFWYPTIVLPENMRTQIFNLTHD
jgi:hypothetical protein